MLNGPTIQHPNSIRETLRHGTHRLHLISILALILWVCGCNQQSPPGGSVIIWVTGQGLLPDSGVVHAEISVSNKTIAGQVPGDSTTADGLSTIFDGYLYLDLGSHNFTSFVVPNSELIKFSINISDSGPVEKAIVANLYPSQRKKKTDKYILTVIGNTNVRYLELTEEEEMTAGYVAHIEVETVDKDHQVF